MNKQKLNLEIAQLVYPECEFEIHPTGMVYLVDEVADGAMFDYCGNWNDLMPEIIKHGISLINMDDPESAWAICPKGETQATGTNDPQIALATCLLAVLKEQNNTHQEITDYSNDVLNEVK